MCKFYIKPFLTNKSQSIQSNFKNGSSYEQKSARLGTFFFGAYSIPFINLSSLALPPAKRRSLTSLLG